MKTPLVTPATILFLVVGGAVRLRAHDPITTKIVWNREISRIVYKRCVSCHRESGRAFSLMTYQEARPWAKAIKEEVLERRMPPFAAVKGFGDVRDEDALTQEELHVIADWVEGGSPEGDNPSVLPKSPDFKDGKNALGVTVKASESRAPTKSGDQLVADGRLTLKDSVTLIGAEPVTMAEGSSILAVVQEPDGSIQPLIWIYDYKPKFERAYYFEKPLAVPAGSKIEIYPPNGGTLALLLKK